MLIRSFPTFVNDTTEVTFKVSYAFVELSVVIVWFIRVTLL
jgi:hypothetical protein